MDSPFRVLLIEDDKDTQINVRDILELDGIQVTAISTGREALEFPNWSDISAVVLDRKLPDGSSDHLLPKIRELAPRVDIVVMTGYADLESSINAIRQGVTDYLIKPVDPGHLRLRLNQIREHREIESALQKEHQFVDQILGVSEAIIVVLDLQGSIIRCNPYLAAITEHTIDEIQGVNWFDVFVPDTDRERVRDVFARTVTHTQSRGVVNKILTKSGCTREIRWSNTTLTDAAGQTAAVLAIGLDITDLLEAQRLSLQNERLATIGQTMTALAHESRNALQRIQASVELMRLDLNDHEDACRELNRIESAAEDVERLLEEVRTYAAPLALDLADTRIDALWRESWDDLVQHESGHQAKLSENTGDVSCQMWVDAGRMRQVFRNLFQNAIEAVVGPVQVEIAARRSQLNGKPAVEFCITDNGPGLSKDQQNGVFDAFYTTKSGGTGLGMAIAKRIVEVHQGTIAAGNARSGGAEFKIVLPTERNKNNTAKNQVNQNSQHRVVTSGNQRADAAHADHE